MTIKKCDRCGVVIPDKNSGKTISEVINDMLSAVTDLINPCPDYKITRCGMPVDLCDKCYKDFRRWLNSSEVQK